jgi:hypothetical protein
VPLVRYAVEGQPPTSPEDAIVMLFHATSALRNAVLLLAQRLDETLGE